MNRIRFSHRYRAFVIVDEHGLQCFDRDDRPLVFTTERSALDYQSDVVTPNMVMDTITRAMSQLAELGRGDVLNQLAWDDLDKARRILISKYLPNAEERGR